MLPPPRRENKGNPDSKVSASSVPIQDGAIKKKKKNLWVLHLGYEGENKSKRKEKGKYWIGNTCTWTRFIGTVATQISLFRNSKLVRTTYFYSYVHLESCHLLLARYFVKYPGGVYSEVFPLFEISNLNRIKLCFHSLQKYNPFKIKDTPPFIYPKLGDARRCKAKRRRGEEREKSGSSFRKNLWIGACRGEGGVRNSANSRDKKLSIVADERKLGGNWSSPGQQSIETRGRGVVRHKSWIVGTRYATADRIEAAVSRETMARHNGGNGPALLKHRVIRWTKSSGGRSSWVRRVSTRMDGYRWTEERDSLNFNDRVFRMFSKKFARIEEWLFPLRDEGVEQF